MKIIGETQRLSLRELDNEADANFILNLLNSKSWIKHIGDRGVRTLDKAKDYVSERIANSYVENGYGLWLVVALDKTEVGICGLGTWNK